MITFYFKVDYLADQVRWLPLTHPLVHHLNRALEGCPTLLPLQVTASVMHNLVPSLARLAQRETGSVRDFGMLSLAAAVFDAVGRLTATSSGRNEAACVLPRAEVIKAIALLSSSAP